MALVSLNFYSRALNKNTCAEILLPEKRLQFPKPSGGKRFPVLYLLHGHCHDHTSWIRNTRIEWYLRDQDIIVVFPDGGRGYYVDGVLSHPYQTYLTKELPIALKNWFLISDKPEETYIGGMSMGGYGALSAGLRKPEAYAGVLALSAAIHIRQVRPSRDVDTAGGRPFDEDHFHNMQAIFGESSENTLYDLEFCLKEFEKRSGPKPKFYLSCGTGDFLFAQNRDFAAKAQEISGMDLTFVPGEGIHDWDYWDREIVNGLKFFGLLPDGLERK